MLKMDLIFISEKAKPYGEGERLFNNAPSDQNTWWEIEIYSSASNNLLKKVCWRNCNRQC